MKIIEDNAKLIARYNGKGNPKGYIDPDTLCDKKYDEKIIECYSEATVEKGKNKKTVIRYKGYDFKPDSIVGWKQIRHAYEGKEGWIDAYINLFNCERIATVLWPAYMDDFQTINQNRGGKRFDFVLNDIKRFLDGKSESDVFMWNAYTKNKYTNEWLNKYNNQFKEFINDMHLECFVNKNYEVFDIASKCKSTVDDIKLDERCKVTKEYLDGLNNLLGKRR